MNALFAIDGNHFPGELWQLQLAMFNASSEAEIFPIQKENTIYQALGGVRVEYTIGPKLLFIIVAKGNRFLHWSTYACRV